MALAELLAEDWIANENVVRMMDGTGTSPGSGEILDRNEILDQKRSERPAAVDASSRAALAHDARNLLASLQILSEMLAQPHRHGSGFPPPLLDPDLGEQLRALAEASARMLRRFISVDGSPSSTTPGIEAEPVALEDKPIEDLGRAVRDCESLLRAMAGPRVEIEIACLPAPGRVALTVEDLMRILLNLVRNASEAMPDGGRIRLTVQKGGGASFLSHSRRFTASESRTVLVCVQDNGPGIDPAILPRIFEAGSTTKPSGDVWPSKPGRGQGLHIVRQLVEDAGGRIRALSPCCGGARFEFELPLSPSPRTPQLVPQTLVTGSVPEGRLEC